MYYLYHIFTYMYITIVTLTTNMGLRTKQDGSYMVDLVGVAE